MMRHLAVDIGASSMRAILGWYEGGKIRTQEVWRQPNGAVMRNGHLCWDLDALFGGIVSALQHCGEQHLIPDTLGIDTWAVDYVLLGKDGQMVGDSVSYRDSRTEGMDVLLEKTLPFTRHYAVTGIAKQPFNTVYQLMAQFQEHPEQREEAESFLMVPDYLGYLLTGVKKNEFTNASTTGLLDAATRSWSKEVLAAAQIPEKLFRKGPAMPGTTLGTLRPDLVKKVGYDLTVLLPATHDTGSAFIAVPKENENALTLSSGTWSLLGVELPAPVTTVDALNTGFTNEGGYGGTVRFLKNIMGLWMLQEIRRDLDGKFTFTEMADLAGEAESYPGRVDVTDNRFLAPECMTREVEKALNESGYDTAASLQELLSCVNHSLAEGYAAAITDLEQMLGRKFTSLCIVGGGCNNQVLDQWSADATRLPVIAGPDEGTALGNLMVQMIASGTFQDLQEARSALRISTDTKVWIPKTAQQD